MSSPKQSEIVKHIVALIFSFLLTLCLASIFVLFGCKVGIFNENTILKQIDNTEYAQKVNEAIYSNSLVLTMPSGLPDSILDGVISEAEVKKDCRNAVIMGLKGQGYNPDMSGLEKRFEANIEAYMEEHSITMEEGTQLGIQELLDEIKAEYKKCLAFPFIKYFVKYQNAFSRFFLPAVALLMILTALICGVLIKMQKWPHRGMRYISYATLASTIMVIVPTVWLLVSGVHKRINISPQYLYDLVTGVLSKDLLVFLVIAGVGIALFIGELVLINRLKRVASTHRRGRKK